MTTPLRHKDVAPLAPAEPESVLMPDSDRQEDTDQVARDRIFAPNRSPHATDSVILDGIRPPAMRRTATGETLLPKSRDTSRLVLTIKDSGNAEPIEVQKDQSLVLELAHNPTTGYKWGFDPTIVAPKSDAD